MRNRTRSQSTARPRRRARVRPTPTRLDRQMVIATAAVTARCELGRQVFTAHGAAPVSLETVIQADDSGLWDEVVSRQGNAVLARIAGMTVADVEQHIGDLFEFADVCPDTRIVGALTRLGYLQSDAATA